MIGRAALLLLALGAAPRDPLAGRTAGPPAECIDLDTVQGPDIIDVRTILYRQNSRRIWQTGPEGGACGSMRSGDALIVSVQGRLLCRNDRFQVHSGGYVSPRICRMSGFTPYDLPR